MKTPAYKHIWTYIYILIFLIAVPIFAIMFKNYFDMFVPVDQKTTSYPISSAINNDAVSLTDSIDIVVESQTENQPQSESTQSANSENLDEDKDIQVKEAGDRLNPVPLNNYFSGSYKRNNEDFGFTIGITEILRGEDATALAISKNQFNEVPEGKDLILFKVSFTLDKSTDPEPFLCSGTSFDYFSGTYSEASTFVSIAGLENLHAKLYEGGQTEGWLYTTADPSDASPLACFMETVWLALY